MVGPIEFHLNGEWRQVMHVAPWAEEPIDADPILKCLRGDFFCMPFGLSFVPFEGELHPLHGETANQPWSEESLSASEIRLQLETTIRPAKVSRSVSVRKSEANVYQSTVVSGGVGPVTYGMHAMPKFPSAPGSGLLSFSPYSEGLVFPGNFEEPSLGGYTSLKPGTFFESVTAVPTRDGGTADLTRYPARPGYEDLVMLLSEPGLDFAWSAVTFPDLGYVWFCLKDPRVLPSTMLWISNGGRHYAPWNGRHRGVMGIEEVCTGLPSGIGEAVASNLMADRGHKTYGVLDPDSPLAINVILGSAAIPSGFGRVADIQRTNSGVVILGTEGAAVDASCDTEFLYRTH